MKITFTFLTLLFTTAGIAQNKLHFGVQGNVNYTTGITTNSDSLSNHYKGIGTGSIGYQLGGVLYYDISDKLSLQTGVLFRKSGDKSNEFTAHPMRPVRYKRKFKEFGFSLPINLNYKFNEKLYAKIGGSFVYNFSCESILDYSISVFGESASKNTELTAIHFTGNAGIGIKFSSKTYVEPSLQYNFTKTGIINTTLGNPVRNYLALGVNFGYRFN
jgi:hypothetical protein